MQKVFRGKTLSGVMVLKDEDEGMYEMIRRQKNSVVMESRLTDDVELRDGQTETLYNFALKNLLSSAADAPTDFILQDVVGGSDSQGSMSCRLLITAAGGNASSSSGSGAGAAGKAAGKGQISSESKQPEDDDDERDGMALSSSLLKMLGCDADPKAKSKAKAKPKAQRGGAAVGNGANTTSHAGDEKPPALLSMQELRMAGMRQPRQREDPEKSAEAADPKKRAKGRKSASEVHQSDESFLDEVTQELAKATTTDEMVQVANEKDLASLSQTRATICIDIANKTASKLAQVKRRKGVMPEAFIDKVKDLNTTAATFVRLFGELSSSTPKAAELSSLIAQAAQHGFDCGKVAGVKMLKAELLDLLKFGKYADIAQAAADYRVRTMSGKDDDDDETEEYVVTQLVMAFEQMFQKLLRNVPQTQARFGCPPVQNIRKFFDAIENCDKLDLKPAFHSQTHTLRLLLAHDDKTVLPTTVQNALVSVRKHQPHERLFIALSSLPQGVALLSQAEERAKKRLASESSLVELQEVTDLVDELTSTKLPELNDKIDAYVNVWDRLLKLKDVLAEKEEVKNIEPLDQLLRSTAAALVNHHVEHELSSFIQSQCVHSTNKLATTKKPSWAIDKLRKFLPQEVMFRTVIIRTAQTKHIILSYHYHIITIYQCQYDNKHNNSYMLHIIISKYNDFSVSFDVIVIYCYNHFILH